MKSSEDISSLFQNSPFIKIGVALYDNVCGIRIDYQWNFSDVDNIYFTQITPNDIFKMDLSTANRQDTKFYQNCKISKFELPQYGFYIISSIFMANYKSQNTYFSLGVIMKSSEIINNLYFVNYLNTQMRTLSKTLKKCIEEEKSYSLFTPHLKDFLINIYQVISSINKFKNNEGMKLSIAGSNQQICHDQKSESLNLANSDQKTNVRNNLNPNGKIKMINYNLAFENDTTCNFSEIDFSFLAILLTSHLQTQMSTVIECQSIKMAYCIAMFLDRFLFQGQREMSSLEIHECVIPGLFLQFVTQQKTARNKMMEMLNRPTTWARLSDQTVEQIIPFSNLNNNTNNSTSHINQISVKTPAPWACKTIQLVQQAPASMQKIICDIQMKDISWSAASYSILGQSQFIAQSQSQSILRSWSKFTEKSPVLALNVLGQSNISHEEDLKLIVSIGQLLDLNLATPKNS